jgi:hypothetical protein
MTTLVEIAEKIGELRGDVRASREDLAETRAELKASHTDLGTRLSQVELGLAKVQTQTSRRRLRERVAVAVAVTILGTLWAALSAIPGRVWVAVAKALGTGG